MINVGKFKMSTMYAGTKRVNWRHLFRKNVARPRALHTTWMTCHEKLPTKERLKIFQIIHEDICSLCKLEIETVEHLFFNAGLLMIFGKGSCIGWKLIINLRVENKNSSGCCNTLQRKVGAA